VINAGWPALWAIEIVRASHEPKRTRPCEMGLEGIVSKGKDSPYRSGRSPDWLKLKNPACEAVRREAEEDWGR
jgi:ATP-dependent DNA ligase